MKNKEYDLTAYSPRKKLIGVSLPLDVASAREKMMVLRLNSDAIRNRT